MLAPQPSWSEEVGAAWTAVRITWRGRSVVLERHAAGALPALLQQVPAVDERALRSGARALDASAAAADVPVLSLALTAQGRMVGRIEFIAPGRAAWRTANGGTSEPLALPADLGRAIELEAARLLPP